MAQAFRTQNLRLLASILDANDNELIKSPSLVASAVNELTISNAATTVSPSISATGDDANISLNLISKGTGNILINGKAISLANSFTTAGNFSLSFTTTGNTSLTLPTSGTLATTSQIPTVYDNTLTLAGSGGVSVSATPTFTANASADKTITITIADAALTLGKLANIGGSTILGNSSPSSAGAPAALSVATVASMLSNQTMNIVGTATNVTGIVLVANGGTGVATANANTIFVGPSSGSAAAPSFRAMVTADIPTGIVSYAKIQYVANTARVLGRISSLSGEIEELTGANIVTVIDTNAVSRATNLAGGIAGQIPYQSGANTTAFSAAGTASQVLLSGAAGAPTWASQSSLSVGSATTAGSVTNALTISSPLTGTSYNGSAAISIGLPNASDTVVGAVSIGAQTFAGNKTFKDAVIISGDLTVNGTTITINSSTLSVDDKNIELGAVIAIASLSSTSNITAASNIVDVTSTSGLIVGQALTKTTGTGAFGTNPVIASIVSSTQFTVSPVHVTTGSIVFSVSGATDITADTGGITLKGATDKTFNWLNATSSWTSSENLDIVTGKTYKINNVGVLSSTTLGSSVVNSSLTSVGTLVNLTVTNTITGSVSGSASSLSTSHTFWGQTFNGTQDVSGNLTSVGNITGSSGLTITAGGSNQNVVLTPTGTGYTLLNGNVGIGTISPRTKFDVLLSGTANTGGSLAPSIALFTGPGLVPLTDGSRAGANFNIESNTAQASDVGASLMLGGRYVDSSTVSTGFAAIFGAKTNSTSNNLNGYLTFYTNTNAVITEKMRITSGGDVGIGTTIPSALLHVFGATPTIKVQGNSAATSAKVDLVGTFTTWSLENQYVNGANNDMFRIYNSALSADAITINRATNNVGIGQTNPGYKLDVGGIARVGDSLFVTTATTADAKIEIGSGRSGNGNSYIDLIGDATYTDYGLRLIRSNGGANTTSAIAHRGTGAFYITTVDAAAISFETTNITRMTIASGGNVGVGTIAPVAKLHINSTTAGETVLRSDGTNGTLFSVVDDLSDSLMSVNNSAGLPVLEVFADDRIVAGQYGQNDFVVINNKVGLGANSPINKLSVIGSASIGDSTYNVSAPTNGLIVQGNVGIGTNNPSQLLEIKKTTGSAIALLNYNDVVKFNINASSGGAGYVGMVTNHPLIFVINDTEKWKITSTGIFESNGAQTIRTSIDNLTLATLSGNGHIVLSPHGNGNVGIGTATPGAKLDVVGSAAISSTLTVTGVTALNGAVNLSLAGTPAVTLGASTTYGVLTASGTNAASIYLNGATRAGYEAKLQFGAAEHQWFNGSLSSQIMTLNTNGLGVGITSPAATLDVNGTTFLRGNLDAGRTASLNTTAAANGTGGGNRGFDTSFSSTTTGFTGTDNTDQGFGYFAATIVSGKSYEVSATMVVTNGAPLSFITSSGLNFATQTVQSIISSPVSNTIYRFVATADAAFFGIGINRTTGTMTAVVSNFSIKEVSILVTSNSNVGIVTTSPTDTLDVNGTARIRSISASGSAATIFLSTGATGVLVSRTAAEVRSDIGAGTGNGSVTSVSGTGTVSGISLSGTVTTTGNLTLGGTLSVTPSNFASQTANTFLAAPTGAAGTPTFRSMVSADIPTDAIVTTKIANSNVTLAKIQNIAVSTVLGNSSSSAAQAPLEISMTTLAAMLSGKTMDIAGNATNVTGVVAIANGGTGIGTTIANAFFVGPDGSTGAPSFRAMVSADIPNSIVSYSKIQNVSATARVLGRITAGVGIVEELSGANIATIIGSSAITNASNVTIATDDTTNSSYYLYFGANITGNTPLKGSTKIRYNPSTGAFSATTKSFRIPHPTKPQHDLVYGSLESPYHGVRLTGKGKTKGNRAEIFLPDYVKSLIDEETVNIQLTVIKCAKILYIENIIINDNKFTVKYDKSWYEKSKDVEFYWDFTAERKDVAKLIVEEKL